MRPNVYKHNAFCKPHGKICLTIHTCVENNYRFCLHKYLLDSISVFLNLLFYLTFIKLRKGCYLKEVTNRSVCNGLVELELAKIICNVGKPDAGFKCSLLLLS